MLVFVSLFNLGPLQGERQVSRMRPSLNGTTRLCCMYFLIHFYYHILMIPRPSDGQVSVTVFAVFQLGSTLGTRELSTKQTINSKHLFGGAHRKYHGEVPATCT